MFDYGNFFPLYLLNLICNIYVYSIIVSVVRLICKEHFIMHIPLKPVLELDFITPTLAYLNANIVQHKLNPQMLTEFISLAIYFIMRF